MSGAAGGFPELDPVMHQPSRLQILSILAVVESADFLYLLSETGLTKGNLSSHLAKLEEAGVVSIEKTYDGKLPLTLCRLTDHGRARLVQYRERLGSVMERLPHEGRGNRK